MTIPLGAQLFSLLLGGGKTPGRADSSPVDDRLSDRVAPDIKLNSRFFLAANISILLFVLAMLLVPAVVVLHGETRMRAALAVGGLVTSLVMSVLYLVRKGDLHWVRSFFRS